MLSCFRQHAVVFNNNDNPSHPFSVWIGDEVEWLTSVAFKSEFAAQTYATYINLTGKSYHA